MPAPSAAPLRVDLLGAPVLTMHGQSLQVDTRKAAALLAVLTQALADGEGPVPRERLAAMFWPEADDAHARATLRRTLSVLLAATGDAVRADRSALGLDPVLLDSDVVRFARLRAGESVEDWARAASLLRGEFMSGFGLRDCRPFEDWLSEHAAVLRRDAGELMERLVKARLRAGELHSGLADTARWLGQDPLHEPAHRTLMRLLAWTGRRQDALDAYDQCVRLLSDELGVAPVRATTAVFEAIRTGSLPPPKALQVPPVSRVPARAAAPPAPAGQVPPGARSPLAGRLPLIGRDQALATLLAAAGGPGAAGGGVAAVTGETGIGRSRLLQEFAGRLGRVALVRAHEGEAGLAFAPIADLLREALPHAGRPDAATGLELSRVLPELLPPGNPGTAPAPVSGFDPLGGRDRFFDAVVRTLAAARFDAVVLDDVQALSSAGADFLSYLLYRLDRLGCLLVLAWRTPGLPPRHPVRLALATGTPRESAVFVGLGRLGRAEIGELVAATGSKLDVDELLERTAGLPLVLAEAVRSGRADVLGDGVRELLAARLSEVSEEAGQVLAALAVCGGVAEQRTLRAVSGRGELETVEAVEQGLRSGLLTEEGSAVAFSHDALRQVAYDDLSMVRRRLLHARAADAWTAADATDTGTNPGLVAHHWHLAGRDTQAAEWGWAAALRAATQFAHGEALQHLQFVQALGVDRAEVALAEGDALVALGRYEPALAAYARAVSHAGDPLLRATAERRRAGVHARTGGWELADSELAVALELAGTGDLRAQLLADRALVALRSGTADEGARAAARWSEEALTCAGTSSAGYVRNAAGIVALAGGRHVEAQAAFVAALQATHERPDDELRTAALNNLARAQASSDPRAAVATARQALALGEARGDRHRLAALHANLADRLHEMGQADAAMAELKRSAALFAEIGTDPLGHPAIWTLTAW